MPSKCSVIGCKNRKSKGFKIYKIPEGKNDIVRRNLWLDVTERKQELTNNRNAVICEVHFSYDQFEPRIAGKLKPNAVPSFHPNRCPPTRIKQSTKEVVPPTIVKITVRNKNEIANDVSVNNNYINIAPYPVNGTREPAQVCNKSKREQQDVPVDNVETNISMDPVNVAREHAYVNTKWVPRDDPSDNEDIYITPDQVDVTIDCARTKFGTNVHLVDPTNNAAVVNNAVYYSQLNSATVPAILFPVNVDNQHTHITTTPAVSRFLVPVANQQTCVNAASTGPKFLVPVKKLPIPRNPKHSPDTTFVMDPSIMGDLSFCVRQIIQKPPETVNMDDLRILKTHLLTTKKALRRVEKRQENFQKNLEKLFNADQLRFLERSKSGCISWSEDTFKKALQLQYACGVRGYNCLLSQGFPFPSERTLRRKIKSIKVNKNAQNNVVLGNGEVLPMEVSISDENEMPTALTDDNITHNFGNDPENNDIYEPLNIPKTPKKLKKTIPSEKTKQASVNLSTS